jgi:hypothetical protein
MADYYPLIARAVAGLEKNTGEGRRILYERARTALVTQLRGVVPALSESDITRERLALEEAIRKVEAEAARQSREGSRFPEAARRPIEPARPPAPPPSPKRDIGPGPTPPRLSESPRSSHAELAQALGRARTQAAPRGYPDEGMKGLRDVIDEAENLGAASAQASRSARGLAAVAPTTAPDLRLEPRLDEQRPPVRRNGATDPGLAVDPDFGGSLEPRIMLDDARPATSRQRAKPAATAMVEHDESERPVRAGAGGFVRTLIVMSLVMLVGAALFWQRQTIGSAVASLSGLSSGPAPQIRTPPREVAPPRGGKIPDRIAPQGQTGLVEAQRVVLYEEDPSDPAGKQSVGTATWREESMSAGPGQPADVIIRANIEIPDRGLKVAWSLRRNNDRSLPASHTVELMFSTPADFSHGGIANIPGLLMKQSEQTRGVPLAGQSVKVTTGYFLIGLSSVESDLQRNVQLLRERAWFDIPIVYADGRRAILAVEKGPPGETVFADAFNVWAR